MSHDDDWTPEEREQLMQELLELHFGCHEDPEALEARLQREPALRKLQADALAQTEVLKQAVHPELAPLDLRPDDNRAGTEPASTGRRWWQRPVGRITAVAAAGLLATLTFLAYERVAEWNIHEYRAEHLHLTVSAPKAVPSGAPWSFTVQANDLSGERADCALRWQAFDAEGEVLAAGDTQTQAGVTTVALAANLVVPHRVEVFAANSSDEVRQEFSLSTAQAGPLVHVSTDRQTYQPGEPIYLRTVVLDRVTQLPLKHITDMQVRLLDARDSEVATQWIRVNPSGVGSAVVRVPEDRPGGPHKVVLSSSRGQFAEESAAIIVRRFQKPQLLKDIALNRESYAPGARGAAQVTATRLGDNSKSAGAAARGSLVIDGVEVWHEERYLGANGSTTFRFEVPKEIDAGAARFVAKITDGGVVETLVKPFLVPTGKVHVAMFPEGGELIAGVENGLYLECTDSLGRPIDTTGAILDDAGRRVTAFRTAHQGRARLAFIPEADTTYKVRVAGKSETTDLPAIRSEGIALRLVGEDIQADAPLRMAVAGRGNGPWMLGVFCRGVLVGQTTLRSNVSDLQAISEVPLPATASGVLRATVFDRDLQPVAERLVRRRSQNSLKVEIMAEAPVLSPGDRQTVRVKTTDEDGNYTPAIVGLSCIDLATTQQDLEPRISLVDQAMLCCDIKQLETLGDFFITDASSSRNVDLLLGTRGWRRFIWRNDEAAKEAIAAAGDAGSDILTREGFSQTPQVISNLSSANAEVAELNRAFYDASKGLHLVLLFAIAALLTSLLAEGVAQALRRFTPSFTPLLRGASSLATAGLLLTAGVFVFELAASPDSLSATLGFPTSAMPATDFQIGGREGAVVQHLRETPEVTLEGAFDSNVWNSAIGLGGGAGGQYAGRGSRGGRRSTPNFEQMVVENTGDSRARLAQPRLGQPSTRTTAGRRLRSGDQVQYHHVHRFSRERRDFTPTILFHTLLITDEQGEGAVSFDTTGAVTTWKVTADAHIAAGDVGRIGSGSRTFTTQLPLQVEAKLPTQVSAGDRLLIPITAILKDDRIPEVTIAAQVGEGLALGANAPMKIQLDNRDNDVGRGRALMPIEVGDQVGPTTMQIVARAGRYTDRIQHVFEIAPRGFPHSRSAGGNLTEGSAAEWELTVPRDAVAGSGEATLKIFPSPIASLAEGLAGILREPHGCFEQASSSNYPNTLVLNLMEATGDNVPTVAARARQLLPKGYAKITGFECQEEGYEWFGRDPGHEALSAYGLLQFHDMANVYDVDMEMLGRTKRWLLQRRDGKGNYPHAAVDHHSFGGRSPSVTNAYVTYALLQAGTPEAELEVEIDALVKRVTVDDPYELALIACALNLTERKETELARQRLSNMQAPDGSLPGAKATITMSGERDRLVEATGFALLAWLPDASYAGNVRRAIEYLQTARNGSGTFGATQATIVALRAITAYAVAYRSNRQDGVVRIYEGDRELVKRTFSSNDVEAMTFDLWPDLPPGDHTLRLQVEGGGDSPLPWVGEIRYHAVQPANDPNTATTISTSLRTGKVQEGATVALDVVVENVSEDELPTPMAIIGVPAGLEIATTVVEDLHKAGKFAFWEIKGRELILYWRKMEPESKHELVLDLTARVPGTSAGPASRTYLYYTPDQKYWAEPLSIEVTASK